MLLDINCSQHLPLPAWLSWIGLGPTNLGRLAGFLFVLALLAAVAWPRGRSSKKRPELPRGELLACLAPAFWSLAVFAALLAAYIASGFYRGFDAQQIDFLRVGPPLPNHPAEIAASGIWAATFCAVMIGLFAVCWVATKVYWDNACGQTNTLIIALFVLAAALATTLGVLGRTDVVKAFGSDPSALMLCGTWRRSGLGFLGPVTDALNIVAAAIAIIASASFCLLLWCVRTTVHAVDALHDATPLLPAHVARQRRQSIARDARKAQVLMDYALYAGAAALVAGLLEVVATLSWSYAPFQSSAEVKLDADLCKAMQPAPPASAGSAVKAFCETAEQHLKNASAVDGLRRFTRSIAIMYGAVFSALLAAMYLPVAFAQQELIERLACTAPEPARDAAPEPEFDRSTVQRVFNVLAALGPLAAAVVSAVFGL